MPSPFRGHRVALALLLLGGALGAAGAAPAGPAVPLAIGVLDADKLAENADPVRNARQQISDTQQRLNRVLEELDKVTYLNAGEVKEYVGLLEAKPPLTAAQKARMAEITKAADDRQREWLDIAMAKPPTAAQTKRREELEAMRGEREQEAKNLEGEYRDQLNKLAQGVLPKVKTSVDATIDKVAKEKGLFIVLPKRMTLGIGADGKPVTQDVVLWGGTDITDEVVKRLNGK